MATFRWWAQVPESERATAYMAARPERHDQCEAAVSVLSGTGEWLFARCTSHGRELFNPNTRLCRRHRESLAQLEQ